MNDLERVSHETMVFMRGNYRLDEIGDGKNELKFKQGQKTILTIYIHEDRFSFLVIFGKKEREYFETVKSEYPEWFLEFYENTRTYHDGKWMLLDVRTVQELELIKKLIVIKKKPNRKPFPKENAVYGECGHRCDLCIHYTGMSEEKRNEIEPILTRVWGTDDWSMRCGGCGSDNCYCQNDPCHAKLCAAEKGLGSCRGCEEYPCLKATVADPTSMIHTNTYRAEDITWAILPYTPMQYENLNFWIEKQKP